MLHTDSVLIGPRLIPAVFLDLLLVIAILFASWKSHNYVPSRVTFDAYLLQSNIFCSKFIIIFPPYSFCCCTCNAQYFFDHPL
jgi:hypothetical protein